MRVEARPGVSTSTLPSISVLVRPREDRDSHTAQSRLCAQPVQQTETRLLTNYPAEYQLLRSLAVWLVRDVTEQNSLIFIRRSIIYLSSLVTALTTGGDVFHLQGPVHVHLLHRAAGVVFQQPHCPLLLRRGQSLHYH